MNGADHPLSLIPVSVARLKGTIQEPCPEGRRLEGIAELSSRIVQGDEAAFAEFYRQCSGRLFRFILLLTQGAEEPAREVQQLVLIKAARKFRVFTSEAELWAWLAQVARNAWVDYLRRERRRVPTGETDVARIPAASISEAECELDEMLKQALGALAADERALIESTYFARVSQRQLAAETGRTVKGIESKLARTRAKLRTWILERMKR